MFEVDVKRVKVARLIERAAADTLPLTHFAQCFGVRFGAREIPTDLLCFFVDTDMLPHCQRDLNLARAEECSADDQQLAAMV